MGKKVKLEGIQWLESEDPTFEAKDTRVARANMTNPTAKAFSYTAELYLDVNKVASSGVISFTLAAGETRAIAFTVTMPAVEGTFPVFLDVFVDTEQVGAYRATEDVTVDITPAIVIGPITWE